MLFTDIIAEYNEIIVNLEAATKFYSLSKDMVSFYYDQFSSMTNSYYNAKQGSPKDALANAVNNLAQKTFDKVLLLNTASRELYQCISAIQGLSLSVPILADEVKNFILIAKQADNEICNIIEAKLPDAKKGNFFSSLILRLYSFNTCYEDIMNIEKHLNVINDFLMEPIPDSIPEKEYIDFSINSLVVSKDFEQITSSINSISSVYDNISRLLEVPLDKKYYIRRIETGSLAITISCVAATAIGIAKFIEFCFNKYLTFKKAKLEIQTMRQELIDKDLEIVEKTLELNPNLENKQELIEIACASAFQYFKFNPQFKMNDVVYDSGSEPDLLEEKINKEDIDN